MDLQFAALNTVGRNPAIGKTGSNITSNKASKEGFSCRTSSYLRGNSNGGLFDDCYLHIKAPQSVHACLRDTAVGACCF